MKKENKFKVGDYIYYFHNKEYGIGKIETITSDGNLYCHWSRLSSGLPKTIDEFNEYDGFCLAYTRAFNEDEDIKYDDVYSNDKTLSDYSNEELLAELQKRLK